MSPSQPQVDSVATFLEKTLLTLLRICFYLLLLAPGLVALLQALLRTFPPWLLSAPLHLYLSKFDSGFQLGPGTFLARALQIALLMLTLLLQVYRPAVGNKLWKTALLFHGLALLSAAHSSHPYEAILTVLDSALLLPVAWVACVITPGRGVPQLMMISGALVATISLMQYGETPPSAEEFRLAGTFFQPNMTASYLVCLLPWLIQQEMGPRATLIQRVLALIVLALALPVLALTATRAAWFIGIVCLGLRWLLGIHLKRARLRPALAALALAAAVGLGLGLVLSLHNPFWLWLLAGLLLVAAWSSDLKGWPTLCLVLALGLAAVEYRVVSKVKGVDTSTKILSRAQDLQGTDFGFEARKEFCRAALLMGLEHPLAGVGPRGFHRYYPSYQTDERWFSKFAHCSPLTVWAEVGAPGALLLGLLAVFWLQIVRRGLSQEKSERRLEVLDGAVATLALTLGSFFDVQWQFPMLPIAWAAWIGFTLSRAASPAELTPPPAPPETAPVGAWTLRPHVVLNQLLIACLGILFAFNLLWALAQNSADTGEILLNRGAYEQAVSYDRDAILLNPLQGSYHHHLGLAMMAWKQQNPEAKVKPDELLRAARNALALDSHRAVHHDLLAKIMLSQQHWPEARAAILQALQCDPVNYPSFYSLLASCLEHDGSPDQAAAVLETCLQRFPVESLLTMMTFRKAEIERQLASIYLQLAELTDPNRRPAKALRYYDGLLKLRPDDQPGQIGRLVCLIQLGRLKEAHREALHHYRLHPIQPLSELLKHIYAMEGLPVRPEDFPAPDKPSVQPK